MREFNLEGPMVADDHYLVPPLDRVDLADIRHLVARKRYFVLHAPRQTGKTSALLALRDLFNAEGDYSCVYVNVECATTAREDVATAIRTVLSELAESACDALGDDQLGKLWPDVLAKAGGHSALRVALTRCSTSDGATAEQRAECRQLPRLTAFSAPDPVRHFTKSMSR